MASNRWAKALVLLAVVGVGGLCGDPGGLAAPDAFPGAETIDVYWMSGVINNGRACVGVGDGDGLHGHNAYDLIADNSAPPCYDNGVPAAASLRTLGRSSTPHATLRATMSSGEYTDGCDYIEARTVQNLTGTAIATYRYVHATGTTGQWVDLWAGPSRLPTETPIGSTTDDSDCLGGWKGYHTHQDSGNPTSPWSQPNTALPIDDDIAVWDSSKWIHKWTYPLPDTDGDNFQDAAEVYMGTDRLDPCPDSSSDAAWPPDQNNNRIVIGFDVIFLKPHIGCVVGQPCYDPRHDLNTDGNIQGLDSLFIRPFIGQQCS